MFELDGRVALVTGGARRIGRAIALRLAESGMDIALTYRSSAEDARALIGRITGMGRKAEAIRADLAEPNAAERIHDQFTDRYRALQICSLSNGSGGRIECQCRLLQR